MEQLPLQGISAVGNWFNSSIFDSLNITRNVSACWNVSCKLPLWNSKSRICQEGSTAAARTGLLWCHPEWASERPGPTCSLFSKAASWRSQRMLPKCAKFLFLTKFLGCTGITLCNTDSCLNAFLFSFYIFLFCEWSQEKLTCDNVF